MTTRYMMLSVLIFCGTLLLCVWLFVNYTRYTMVGAGNGAYRYDRITGEVWYFSGSSFGPVKGPVNWVR